MSDPQPITILFKGGRLPSWYQLEAAQKTPFEQEHVDLMLSVAAHHRMRRLSGYRLVTPQGAWERFWVIQFPTLAGAEAWISAEMAPPYGRFGLYDYQLARPLPVESDLFPEPQKVIPAKGDPHQVPPLTVDRSRVIALVFEHDLPGRPAADPEGVLLTTDQPIRRLERFQLLTPQAAWQRVWLVELPDLDTAEQWVEAVSAGGQTDTTERSFHLTRPWAPSYFASWITPD